MDQVIISDLRARGVIGVNEWERKVKQEMLINFSLHADLADAGKTENLANSIDYSQIAKAALSIAEGSQRLTVEALAGDIAIMCLEHKPVIRVRLRVEKPGAVRFSRSVGLEIDHIREVSMSSG